MNTKVATMACALCFVVACDSEEPTKATQDGVAPGEDGVGVMAPVGITIPGNPMIPGDDGVNADDVWLMIRSFEPNACGMLDAYDPFAGASGFSWTIQLLLPAKRLAVGEVFEFGGNECDEDCVIGGADTYGGQGGPAGPWGGSGVRCGDESYDGSSSAEIVAIEDGALVIEIRDLCLIDSGPISADLSDDPNDDVTYTADGRYRVNLCGELPPSEE
ncbi:MAG: hypothetical protein JNL21_24125 [Myxococcales bacterium]|nr:hypothetical protein [Myxococcales bacterium]